MNDLELILAVIEARAEALTGARWAYSTSDADPDSDLRRRCAFYGAQADALRDLARELAAAAVPSMTTSAASDDHDDDAQRTLLVVEMTGVMRATILQHDDWNGETERFKNEHARAVEWGEGRCHTTRVNIPPRARASSPTCAPSVDIRWAFIQDVGGNVAASIHNTEAEADRRAEEFQNEYADWIESDDAVWTVHAIAVPRLGREAPGGPRGAGKQVA